MTAFTALGRAAAAIVVAAALIAWAVFVLCLAVVAVGVVFDALTGGLTP